jgi:hypothetical protein
MVSTGRIISVLQHVAEVEFLSDPPSMHEVVTLVAECRFAYLLLFYFTGEF